MTGASSPPASEAVSARLGYSRLLVGLVALAFAVGIARRLLTGWDAPLWLDETWTGAIAIRPDVRGLIDACLHELSGPVYYSLIWIWEKIAGSSDVALRLPSLIFSLLTPVLILLYGHSDRRVRLIWAALAILWLPGLQQATEARPYSLLFLMGTVQAVIFLQLLGSNSRRLAFGWSIVSALLILTHYHALVVTGLQGLAYLAVQRKAAFRNWPALLVFVPVAGWMSIHFPLLIRAAAPGVAWQQVLQPSAVKILPDFLLGGGRFAAILLLLIGITSLGDLFSLVRKRTPLPYTRDEILTVGASVAAVAFVFGLGFVRPSFNSRYLIPYAPGLLLGVALWARHWGRRWNLMPAILVLAFIILCARDLVERMTDPTRDFRRYFSWQEASTYLASKGARHVEFFWDNPTGAEGEPKQQAKVASFFFDRMGLPIQMKYLSLAKGGRDVDPNPILAQLTDEPGEAFIWISDVHVAGTLAVWYPPNIEFLARDRQCRNYGREHVTVLACVRPLAMAK